MSEFIHFIQNEIIKKGIASKIVMMGDLNSVDFNEEERKRYAMSSANPTKEGKSPEYTTKPRDILKQGPDGYTIQDLPFTGKNMTSVDVFATKGISTTNVKSGIQLFPFASDHATVIGSIDFAEWD